MAQKPSIPKGTRDFLPLQMIRRNYIFDTIRTYFVRYGYLPIETPAMEKRETLMGKYGEEGDRLIFKIAKRGDKLGKVLSAVADGLDVGKLNPKVVDYLNDEIAEEALRYDLTVPFARFVVQNQNDITFPFKRSQIQPVWRADRPQKGRYREFFQCDADVVGSDSLVYEVELVHLFDDVLTDLKIPSFTIKINNRKILSGIAEVCEVGDKLIDMTVAIDKLDKIGEDGVVEELKERGISDASIDKITPLFSLEKGEGAIPVLKEMLASSKTGMKGIEELEYIFKGVKASGLKSANLEFDVTLARGLNYYTGAIFEVKANNVSIGSICGGGRYDDLTGIFGMPGVSGVGISFGADRIYDVLEELNLFPKESTQSTQVLLINFGPDEEAYLLPKLNFIRQKGINSELYPDSAKLKKQFKYADDKNIPYVFTVGSREMESEQVVVKNMATGEQSEMNWEEAIKQVQNG